MVACMSGAILLLIFIPGATAETYTMVPNSNAYRNDFGYFGAEHLDHCERANSTLDQCKEWCTMDCECDCLVVFRSNGACFRRHSCSQSDFQTDNNFDVYVKDGHNSNCSKFNDLGYDTQCNGPSLSPKIVTNVGSLEECKNVCSTLSFECTGIEYLSSCDDTSLDTCKIFTSTIDSANTVQPLDSGKKHYHCLKYTGPVGSSDSLVVGVSMTMDGIDGAALIQDQSAANALGQSVKEAVASQSTHVEPENVIVELRAGSLILDIEVVTDSATSFLDVRQTMKEQAVALQNDIVSRVSNLQAVDSYIDAGGSISITASAFNLTQPVPTTTETATLTSMTTLNVTTTEEIEVSLTRHLAVLSTMLMWLTSCLIWA